MRKLNSKNLTDYLALRINEHSKREKGQSHVLLTAEVINDEEGGFLEITDHKKRVFHTMVLYVTRKDSSDSIEISIEPHFPGVSENDFAGFLEKYIAQDQIFQKGRPFYGHAPRTDVLQRTESPGKMECLVVDEKAGNERLRKAIYDYMIRPCIFYILKEAGNFSSKQ